MIDSIIRWILNLLGLSKPQAANMALQAAGAGQPARASAVGAVKGLEHLEGAQHVRIVSGNVIRQEQGAQLIHDEEDDEMHWTNDWNREIPAEQWSDEWGPVSREDFDTFWYHKTEFDLLHAGDPEEAERKVQSFGYRDMGHFFQVETSFLKHYGQPHSGTNLDEYIWDQDRVSKAAMAGMMKMQQAKSEAAVAANPELLAPIEGVDLETYASVSAQSASGMAPDDFTALLGQHGIDMAKWNRVNAEWTDRMSKDTSLAIVNAYSKAFANAGAGKYGSAAAATGQVMGTTAEAGGGEPVSFDRLCEIQGAMSAWSKSGQDVNAMLDHTFDMTAGDWSAISMWWMTKMTNELSLMEKYYQVSEQYERQYAAGAPAAPDADLSF